MNTENLKKLDPDTLLTPSEVSKYLTVTTRTVQRWIHTGAFPNFITVKSGFLIPWSDVLAYLESKQQ